MITPKTTIHSTDAGSSTPETTANITSQARGIPSTVTIRTPTPPTNYTVVIGTDDVHVISKEQKLMLASWTLPCKTFGCWWTAIKPNYWPSGTGSLKYGNVKGPASSKTILTSESSQSILRGRTNAIRLYHQTVDDEKEIHYDDYTSSIHGSISMENIRPVIVSFTTIQTPPLLWFGQIYCTTTHRSLSSSPSLSLRIQTHLPTLPYLRP